MKKQKEQKPKKSKRKDGEDPLLRQKNYLINLFRDAVEEQCKHDRIQQNITFHSDDLNEAIDLISKLWSENQRLQEDLSKIQAVQQVSQFDEPHSSIIFQQDNSQIQEMKMLLDCKENEINQLKEYIQDEIKSVVLSSGVEQQNNLDIEYSNNVIEQNNAKQNDVIQQILKKINWLGEIIKKKSSIVSDQSKLSDEGLNLVDDFQQNQFGQDYSFTCDPNMKIDCKVDDLKSIQVLYKQIITLLEENLSTEEKFMNSQKQVEDLKKKLTTQANKLQQITRQQKYDQLLERQAKYKENQNTNSENQSKIFSEIKKEYETFCEMTKKYKKNILEQNGPIDQEENDKVLDEIEINALLRSNQQMFAGAYRLYSLTEELSYKIFDYQNFITMATIEKEFYPKRAVILTQDIIQKLWMELSIPSNRQDNEIITQMKQQQQRYHRDNINEIQPVFWITLDGKIKNQLQQLKLTLESILKIQQKAQQQLKVNKKKKIIQSVKNQQMNYLQYIENEIERTGLIYVKNNIHNIIKQLG